MKSIIPALITILVLTNPIIGAVKNTDDLSTLAQDHAWQRLLHMRKGMMGGEKSGVVTDDFFLARTGRNDPAAELQADIAAFAQPDPEDVNEAARCRFPARFAWCDEHGLIAATDSRASCPRYEAWRSKLEPKTVSLVFASYYFNNPASMYGHTFLTLNRTATTAPTHTLDYTVNFAAMTDSRNGLVFAIKGLDGGYMGRFSTEPYYIKIQQYTNLESRDLWEYELNLSPTDIDRLMKHLWELGSAGMPYFFLNRNCSYQLLPVLEVANPEWDFSKPFIFRAIPIDTLRAVIETPHAVRKRIFRASHRRRTLELRSRLSPDERALVYNLALEAWPASEKNLTQADIGRQPLILDVAYDLWRLRVGFHRPLPESATQREQLLLAARNKLPATDPQKDTDTSQWPSAPETAHPTARIALDVGTDRHSRFLRLDARPALHDLVNPPDGYPAGNELDMFHLKIRANSDGAPLSLDQFTLIEIKSLPAYDLWVRPPTWRLQTGFDVARDLNKKPGSAGIYNLDGGSGLTFALDSNEHARWYSLLEMGAQTGPVLSTGYRVGVGARTGLQWIVSRMWRLNADAAIRRYGWGDASTINTLGFEQAVSVISSWEWRIRAQRENNTHEISTGLYWYF